VTTKATGVALVVTGAGLGLAPMVGLTWSDLEVEAGLDIVDEDLGSRERWWRLEDRWRVV
jgi:hypothetical protein